MYLLDSDVCINVLRGREREAYDWFRRTSLEEVRLPAMVEAELRLGALKSRSARNVQIIEDFLAPFTVVPFDARCARAYARIRADLEERGTIIGPNDLVIAAIALANDAILVTNNIREYQRIKELRLLTFRMVAPGEE